MGAITYVTASFFMGVFHTVVDTILICVFLDETLNNGSEDRPYYMTEEMQELLNKHNTLSEAEKEQQHLAL